MDDSLEVVENIKSNSGRSLTPQLKRHSTPQKNLSSSSSFPTNITPTRGSFRSKSIPKSIKLISLSYESQRCNQKLNLNVSKRIKQRWENDNLFGLRVFLLKQFNRKNEGEGEEEEENEEIEWTNNGLQVNWQSMFSELLLEENASLLKSYLACTNSFSPTTNQIRQRSKTIEECISQWEKAEFSWIKLERKLKKIVISSIVNQQNARQFILIIEDLLLEMNHYLEKISSLEKDQQSSEFIYNLSDEIKYLFIKPIKFISSSRSSSFFQVTLLNSSYHRLLLHATCQFHGRISKVKNPHSFLSFL